MVSAWEYCDCDCDAPVWQSVVEEPWLDCSLSSQVFEADRFLVLVSASDTPVLGRGCREDNFPGPFFSSSESESSTGLTRGRATICLRDETLRRSVTEEDAICDSEVLNLPERRRGMDEVVAAAAASISAAREPSSAFDVPSVRDRDRVWLSSVGMYGSASKSDELAEEVVDAFEWRESFDAEDDMEEADDRGLSASEAEAGAGSGSPFVSRALILRDLATSLADLRVETLVGKFRRSRPSSSLRVGESEGRSAFEVETNVLMDRGEVLRFLGDSD